MLLKRRKMYDTQLGHVQNQQFNIDQVAFNAESIQDTLNTVSYNLDNLHTGIGLERSKQGIASLDGEVQHGRDRGCNGRYGRHDG